MDDGQGDIIEESDPMEVVPDEEVALPDLKTKIDRLKAERLVCDRERKDYLDGWQRAKAELINYKKDEARRLEDIMQYAGMRMTEDFLPVLDGLDMALGSVETRGVPAKRDAPSALAPRLSEYALSQAASAPNAQKLDQKLDEGIRIIRAQLADVLKKRGVEEIIANAGDAFDPENTNPSAKWNQNIRRAPSPKSAKKDTPYPAASSARRE